MRFTKMQGLGNDYVYVDCFSQRVDNPSELAVRISDRHFGIGSDGLILICPSSVADARMRMFNADGSESEMCGNGLRCVAKFVHDYHLARPGGPLPVPGRPPFPASLRIENGRGILTVGLQPGSDGRVDQVCVNMGRPILPARQIPVALDLAQVVNEPFSIDGFSGTITCVSMGNPHAIVFVEDLDAVDLARLGPVIEHHPLFPQRINAHFVKVESASELTVRTWERGSGITLACGTGACACGVAGVLTGRSNRSVRTHLPGGILDIDWSEQDDCVYMTGPAVEVFSGDWSDSPRS
jgi:diaminopimelate epimerase